MDIERIASLITEDPDIPGQGMSDGSMSQSKLQGADQQAKLEKKIQELEAKEAERRKQVLKPQIDKIENDIQDTRLNTRQAGKELANDIDDRITTTNTELDSDLRSIEQLLNQLDKSI